jgi:hypothetical protein
MNQKVNDPIFKTFIEKITFDKNEFEKMTNNTFASDDELVLIKSFAETAENCKKEQLSDFSDQEKDNNQFVLNWIKFQDSRTSALADLYLRNITFSTYNKIRKNSYSIFEDRRAELNKHYDEIAAENNAALNNQRAREQAINSRLLSDTFGNISNSLNNRPKQTTCTPTGFGGFTCR